MLKRFMEAIRSLPGSNIGSILLYVMIFGSLSFSLITIVVSGFVVSEYKATVYKENREKAFHIAEAGINYYSWHLSKNLYDYQDGTGAPGPYLHEFKDKNGALLGYYSLDITPPANSSTVITIESTGWVASQPQSKRTIRAKVSFPSLTEYAISSNSNLMLGNDSSVHGRMHSNSGIKFDGTTDAQISSAVLKYMCVPIHGEGCTKQEKDGIWCNSASNCPTQFFKFPVPALDFGSVSVSIAEVKSGAQNGGLYLSSSGKQGWFVNFTSDGKLSASKVNSTIGKKGDDFNENNVIYNVDINAVDPAVVYDLPANGYLYVDDTVWVAGTLRGKVTLAAASGKSIIIGRDINNGSLVYTAKDGSDRLGLITDKDIIIPYYSPNVLNIDGALYAGASVKRYYYSGDKKDQLNLYGSVASNGTLAWSWPAIGGGVASGYEHVTLSHDTNLINNPPLAFPRGSSYNLVSWEEVNE